MEHEGSPPLEGGVLRPTSAREGMNAILKEGQGGVVFGSKEGIFMPKFEINYRDDETTPDHIEQIATEHGITPEQLIRRAITQFLKGYGLQDFPEDQTPQSLGDLFEGTGVTKPKD